MVIQVIDTILPEVKILSPRVFRDERGFLFESFNSREFDKALGKRVQFVQDNQSFSRKDVLRGLHYQNRYSQGKLVRVLQGKIFDVAVDIRKSSPIFGNWVGVELSSDNKRQLWIPPGFAHGFLTMSDSAELLYKTTEYYFPEWEHTIIWNDPDIGIKWPIEIKPLISAKDALGKSITSANLFT